MIRPAVPADAAAIRRINDRAFGGPAECALVERLRLDGDVLVELVALEAGEVVGHILFSRMRLIREDAVRPAAALAPMAVAPERQRQGVGSALVRAGIALCRAQEGLAAVLVVGHPDYYPRFGFNAAAAAQLASPYGGPAFMALPLAPGALDRPARAVYPPAFDSLG